MVAELKPPGGLPLAESSPRLHSGCWARPAVEAERCCGLQVQLACQTSAPHLRPKNPFYTRILFRIKTLFFFCFVSQNVSSKECRTLKTNLTIFFAFTDFFFSFAGCHKPKSKAGPSLVLLHRYRYFYIKELRFPFK